MASQLAYPTTTPLTAVRQHQDGPIQSYSEWLDRMLLSCGEADVTSGHGTKAAYWCRGRYDMQYFHVLQIIADRRLSWCSWLTDATAALVCLYDSSIYPKHSGNPRQMPRMSIFAWPRHSQQLPLNKRAFLMMEIKSLFQKMGRVAALLHYARKLWITVSFSERLLTP